MARVIRELPTEVRNTLRSGVVITNPSQCIVELILNALDAGASSVAIRINLIHHNIQVVDNGCGMDSKTLDLVGLRYMTSKCKSLDDLRKHLGTFGFRGEALASLRSVSKSLTIESRATDNTHTYCKVFKLGDAEDAVLSTNRPSRGTTVTINDFLYNMPVRQQRINETLDLEEIRVFVEAIALIHPEVAFSLRNDINGTIILQTPRTFEIAKTCSYLFGESITQTLVKVRNKSDKFKVIGYISREAHTLKHLQFIYVNKRIVHKTTIHKLVNSMLAKSSILQSESCRNPPISKKKTYGNWLAYSPPPKRDNSAAFMLNIQCAYIEYDISLDPKKTLIEFLDWSSLLKCVEEAVSTFLEAEGLVSKPPVEEVALSGNKETDTYKMYVELLGQAGFGHDIGRGIRGRAAVRPDKPDDSEILPETNEVPAFEGNADVSLPKTSTPIISQTSKANHAETSSDEHGSRSINIPALDEDLRASVDTPPYPLSLMSEVQADRSTNICASSKRHQSPGTSNAGMDVQSKEATLCNYDSIDSNISDSLKSRFGKVIIAKAPVKRFSVNDKNQRVIEGVPIFKTPYVPSYVPSKGMSVNDSTENSELSEDPVGETDTDNIHPKLSKLKDKIVVPVYKKSYLFQQRNPIKGTTIKSKTITRPRFKRRELSEDPLGGDTDDNTPLKHSCLKTKDNKRRAKVVPLQTTYPGKRKIPYLQIVPKSKVKLRRKRADDELSEDPLGVTDYSTVPAILQAQARNRKRRARCDDVFKKPLVTKRRGVTQENKIRHKSKMPFAKLHSQNSELSEDPIGNTGAKKVICFNYARYRNRSVKYDSKMSRLVKRRSVEEKDEKASRVSSMFRYPLLRHVDKNMAWFRLRDAGQSRPGRLARVLKKYAPTYAAKTSTIKIHKRTLTITRRVTTIRSTMTRRFGNESKALEDRNVASFQRVPNIGSPYFAIPNNPTEHSYGRLLARGAMGLQKSSNRDDGQSVQEKLPKTVQSPYFKFSPKIGVNVTHVSRERVSQISNAYLLNTTVNPVSNFKDTTAIQTRLQKPCYQVLGKKLTASESNTANMPLKITNGDFQDSKSSRGQNRDKIHYCHSNYKVMELDNTRSSVHEIIVPPVVRHNRLNRAPPRKTLLSKPNRIGHSEDHNNYLATLPYDTTKNYSIDMLVEPNGVSPRKCLSDHSTTMGNRCGKTKNIVFNSSDFISRPTLHESKQLLRNDPHAFRNTSSKLRLFAHRGNKQESIRERAEDMQGTEQPSFQNPFFIIPMPRLEHPISTRSIPYSTPSIPLVGNTSKNQAMPRTNANENNSLSYYNRMLSIQRKYHNHSAIQESDLESCVIDAETESNIGDVPTPSSFTTWNSHLAYSNIKIPKDNNTPFIFQPQARVESGQKVQIGRNDLHQVVTQRWATVNRETSAIRTKGAGLENISRPRDSTRRCSLVSRDSVEHPPSTVVVLERSEGMGNSEKLSAQVNAQGMKCYPGEDIFENNSMRQEIGFLQNVSPFNETPMFHNLYHRHIGKNFEQETVYPFDHQMKRRSEKNEDSNMSKHPSCTEQYNDYVHQGGRGNYRLDLPHTAVNGDESHEVPEDSPITRVYATTSEDPEDYISNTNEDTIPTKGQKICVESETANVQNTHSAVESLSSGDVIPNTPQLHIPTIVQIKFVPKISEESIVSKNVSSVTGQQNLERNQILDEETSIAKDLFEINKEWVQRFDGEGKPFFVHIRSGMTSFDPPIELPDQDSFSMTKRYGFLPKGMSPILQDSADGEKTKELSPGSREDVQKAVEEATLGQVELSTVKWREDQLGCAELIRKMVEDSEKKMKFCETVVPNACIQGKHAVKMNNIIMSYTFTKDIFSSIKVLGQLDNKFIVTMVSLEARKSPYLLVFFDQHAVHERIRLEMLMKEYLEEDSDSKFRSSQLDVPIAVHVTAEESRIISNFVPEFERLGFKITTPVASPSVQVTCVPTCLKTRDARDVHNRRVATLATCVENLLREHVGALVNARGVGVRVPAVLQDVVNSEACRGAIKFGDLLSNQQCEMLLVELGLCDLPFQCAHGRPSLVPILDMQRVFGQAEPVTTKPSYWKLK